MIADAVRRLLAASPRGRTIPEIMESLSGQRPPCDRREVAQAVDALHRQGAIVIDHARRWHLRRAPTPQPGIDPDPPAPGGPAAPVTLHGVAVAILPQPHEADVPQPADEPSARPPLDRLLAYYAATQRSDPRGAVKQTAERHARQFQLLHAAGHWWRAEDTLSLAREALPPTFVEALAKRAGTALAIGWPLAVLTDGPLRFIAPVGLLGVETEMQSGRLTLRFSAPDVAINPEWSAIAARMPGWTQGRIEDAFAAPEGLTVPDLAERLSAFMATQVVGRLDPAALQRSLTIGPRDGVFNVAALFLPSDATFTKGTAADLASMAQTPAAQLAGSALLALLGEPSPMPGAARAQEAPPLTVNPVALTPNQLKALNLGLAGPVTAVTGPPGTGKTQVIVSLIASALAANRTVLLTSRNHQAIDAVEEKLRALSPDVAPMVRANDREGARNTDFVKIIGEIVLGTVNRRAPADQRLQDLRALAGRRSAAMLRRERARTLNLALSEHAERRDAILRAAPATAPRRSAIMRWMRRLAQRVRATPQAAVLEAGASLAALDAVISRDAAALAELGVAEDVVALDADIVARMEGLLAEIVAARGDIDDAARLRLVAEQKDHELSGRSGARHLSEAVARLVLAHRPVWAISALSVPARVPLVPCLFDYVVFDEASQCDIASALPLMARARCAVVVGDPNQLEGIAQLGLAQERALLQSVGLPLKGMGAYLQSRNSLFGFVAHRPGTARVMLRDQFRSAPAIVDYLNEAFYGERLRAARSDEGLLAPPGVKPGICWTDTPGRVSAPPSGGACNEAEAEAIAAHLRVLLVDQGYVGGVGVISPFNAQVALLQRTINAAIPPPLRERAMLKVDTVDRFQGGERDLILFSPVAAQGIRPGTQAFLQKEGRRFNVAISRARAVAHVFGDLGFARSGAVRHLALLAERATSPRRAANPENPFDSEWERRVFAALRARGLDPIPQHPVAGRRLDFALFGADGVKLDLEVDGRRWHLDAEGLRKIDDVFRDHQMRSAGWKVRRFWVHELERDIDACLDIVMKDLTVV